MQIEQPALFPISEIRTGGYAQPEPDAESVEDTDDTVEDAA
jgi:hypothetical protein